MRSTYTKPTIAAPTVSRRQLAQPLVALDDDWFANPIQDVQIQKLGDFSQTADGACPVRLTGNQTAFAKPRSQQNAKLVVAREKICADLGRRLNLPTAPVLVRRPDASGDWNDHSLLSLATLPQGRTWGDGGTPHLTAAAPTLEALRVFWSWVGDCDHNGHPNNLLYEVGQGGGVALSAIDHSYTLCHGNGVDPMTVGACAGYGTANLALPEVEGARISTIEHIEALEMAEVENLVCRLSEILTDGEQERMLRVLQERRNGLRAMLGVQAK